MFISILHREILGLKTYIFVLIFVNIKQYNINIISTYSLTCSYPHRLTGFVYVTARVTVLHVGAEVCVLCGTLYLFRRYRRLYKSSVGM